MVVPTRASRFHFAVGSWRYLDSMPMNPGEEIHVVGGGLAGSEAAWQLAERGHAVVLHEMRPSRATAAHKTDRLAELVCSNTFKSTELSNAHGLLKGELVISAALAYRASAASCVWLYSTTSSL